MRIKAKKRWCVCLECHQIYKLTHWHKFHCVATAPCRAGRGTLCLLQSFLVMLDKSGVMKFQKTVPVMAVENLDIPDSPLLEKEANKVRLDSASESALRIREAYWSDFRV